MFSCPSGAKVSWSRAPPPNVMTMIFRFFAAACSVHKWTGACEGTPKCQARLQSRRNSRRVRPRCRAISCRAGTALLNDEAFK